MKILKNVFFFTLFAAGIWGALALLGRPADEIPLFAFFGALWCMLFRFISKKQKDAEKNLRPDEVKARRRAELKAFSDRVSRRADLQDINNLLGHTNPASPFYDKNA